MKVFTVYFRTPNGKEWCHMISETRNDALGAIEGSYDAKETDLDPNDQSKLSLPEWML